MMIISKIKEIKFSLAFSQSQPLSNTLEKTILRAINKCHIGKEVLDSNQTATEEHKEAHHKVVANHQTVINFTIDEYGNFIPTSLNFSGKSYKLEEQ